MIELRSVTKPAPSMSALESLDTAPATARATEGSPGTATGEISRSLRHLVVRGKSGPITPPFETVIGRDERVRILDTDLAPWRMICALRMRGPAARDPRHRMVHRPQDSAHGRALRVQHRLLRWLGEHHRGDPRPQRVWRRSGGTPAPGWSLRLSWWG